MRSALWSVRYRGLQKNHQRSGCKHDWACARSAETSGWWSVRGTSGYRGSFHLGWETPCQCRPKVVPPSKSQIERAFSLHRILALVLFCSTQRYWPTQDCQRSWDFDCWWAWTTCSGWNWRAVDSWKNGYCWLGRAWDFRSHFFLHRDRRQALFPHTWLGTKVARRYSGVSRSSWHDHETGWSMGWLGFSGKQTTTAAWYWRGGSAVRSRWK